MNRLIPVLALLLAAAVPPASAQERLSLSGAVARTLSNNPAVRASAAATGEAAARVSQARAGYLPRVDAVGSWQRGNQPVFAFSSLLAQRRFSESDFAIGTLNHPEPVANLRAGLAVEQVLFDGNRTRYAVSSARAAHEIASLGRNTLDHDLAAQAVRAYSQVLVAMANRRAAEAAVEAAGEDVRRAEARRDAGMVTEADVLALRVHLAEMRERAIRMTSQETIARAQVNQLMGEPLDRPYAFEELPPVVLEPLRPLAVLEQEAREHRPELASAGLQQRLAEIARASARSAFLPQVSLQAFYEVNGTRFGDQTSAWMVGAQARWSLFNGLADLARLRAASEGVSRAGAERAAAESAVLLEVRTAAAEVEAARARQQVGQAIVAQATESQRIVRDRYAAGLASVNDLLRAANAVLDAESLRVAALTDLITSTASLDRATGRAPQAGTR